MSGDLGLGIGRVPGLPVDSDQIAVFVAPYGMTLDEMVNRMGGTS